jgi:parallel beta-helix repeat protein
MQNSIVVELKKIVLLAFVLVLFLTVIVIEVTIRVVSYPAEIDVLMEVDLPVHNIDSGRNFSTIQGAINDNETLDGHTILVDAGEYYENLIVDKALSLIGENKNTTIIDGGKSRSTIYVEADNVEIIGFKIQHGYEQGVFVESSHGTIISGNVITLNIWNGIRTLNCTGVTVSENEIISNPDGGVRVISSSGTNISNNKVSDNGFGIGISHSDNSMVTNNLVANNNRGPGIHLFYSSNSILKDNNMTANLWNLRIEADSLSHYVQDIDTSNTMNGKLVYYLINQRDLVIHPSTFPDIGYLGIVDSRAITVRGLHLTNNGEGILLAYTNGSIIENVQVSNNLIGIHLKHSDGNIILNNTISNNEYGIAPFYCLSNKIYHNNFINNRPYQVHPVDLLSNVWDNGHPSGGNFWSDYLGADLYPSARDLYSGSYQNITGSDGIGDTPYIIDGDNQDNYPLIHPYGSICNLDTNLTYLTIQSAFDAPKTLDGHTIFVEAGIYYEHIVVNKTVSLFGERRETTIIDGGGYGTVVRIWADGVKIGNFTIRNIGPPSPELPPPMDGISAEIFSNVKISNNIIEHNGVGIDLGFSTNNTIAGNKVSENECGIRLDISSNNTIASNDVSSNKKYGIYLWWDSNNNTLTDNKASENEYGIDLDHSSNNTLTNNEVSNNDYGIHLHHSPENILIGNEVLDNEYGIYLNSSRLNSIHHNNFFNNTCQAYAFDSYNSWDDGYPSGGNYWSDYEKRYPNATEIDDSGIWNTPYVIDENNQDNYPIVPEFPTWTSVLFILIVLTLAIAIYKRRLPKTPIH